MRETTDKQFVRKLATDLRDRGVTVWFDEWEMSPGDSISQRIQEGIKESSLFLIVLSSKSVDSEWCRRELSSAWALEIEKKSKFVVPILYEECELPPFLKDKLYADFRQDYSKGLRDLLRAIPLITYEEIEVPCPHCGEANTQKIRGPKLGPMEHKAIDCQKCYKRYFLHVAKGAEGFYTTTSDSSDYAVHPVEGLDLVNAARWRLKKVGAWIPPKQLGGILTLMRETEDLQRENNTEITPAQLQAAMLASERIILYGVSRQRIREFLTTLQHSRYFVDATGKSKTFHTPYTNTYDEKRVLERYLGGCFRKLRRADVIHNVQEAVMVSEFLLEEIQVDASELGEQVWRRLFEDNA